MELKKINLGLPIQIWECSDGQTMLLPTMLLAKRTMSLNNFSADEVVWALKNMLSGKAWSLYVDEEQQSHGLGSIGLSAMWKSFFDQAFAIKSLIDWLIDWWLIDWLIK